MNVSRWSRDFQLYPGLTFLLGHTLASPVDKIESYRTHMLISQISDSTSFQRSINRWNSLPQEAPSINSFKNLLKRYEVVRWIVFMDWRPPMSRSCTTSQGSRSVKFSSSADNQVHPVRFESSVRRKSDGQMRTNSIDAHNFAVPCWLLANAFSLQSDKNKLN